MRHWCQDVHHTWQGLYGTRLSSYAGAMHIDTTIARGVPNTTASMYTTEAWTFMVGGPNSSYLSNGRALKQLWSRFDLLLQSLKVRRPPWLTCSLTVTLMV